MGRFLRRTMPSPWNHSRRNCLAAPSGVFVHSIVMRSLFVSSWPNWKESQLTAMSTASFGSRTPHGGSTLKGAQAQAKRTKNRENKPEALHVCRLCKGGGLLAAAQNARARKLTDRPSDSAAASVDDLDVIRVLVVVGSVENNFGVRLRLDVAGRDRLSHSD